MTHATFHRRTLLAAAGAAGLATLAGPAAAQADKSVRFVLPNATGSGVDAVTRAAQPALACGTRSPPICSTAAPTCARCRNCWATRGW